MATKCAQGRKQAWVIVRDTYKTSNKISHQPLKCIAPVTFLANQKSLKLNFLCGLSICNTGKFMQMWLCVMELSKICKKKKKKKILNMLKTLYFVGKEGSLHRLYMFWRVGIEANIGHNCE